MTLHGRLRSAVVIAGVVAVGAGTGVWADPAMAAAVSPAATCGWRPANNSDYGGGFTGQGINIRSGPSTGCGVYGLGYENGQNVVLRCYSGNWMYITDTDTNVTGWVDIAYLWGPTTDFPVAC
ncbi:hypothetical protein [Actinospica sp.]|jgi:uncharacterized protein YraI|uniref:hypothetical protein n=1 Tax=Actinospica sp. TaxID=1872142 RepID=UPI002BDB5BD2|nr:hypothetical protein [Actinospica sp.]HWG23609.1 hypothetical protein [Actinospica sp.]